MTRCARARSNNALTDSAKALAKVGIKIDKDVVDFSELLRIYATTSYLYLYTGTFSLSFFLSRCG
jgi:hypothetical protein